MLQNRVTPFGDLIQTKARGAWTGTRGVIHNEQQQIIRPFKLKAWITCKLEFKGRQRQMMTPNRYTELFFLDEATAFAAGHRPCCECRREDYNQFKSAWLAGNPGYNFNNKTSIQQIDAVIHAERIDKQKSKVSFEAYVEDLPPGTFISLDNQPYLVWEKQLLLWSPFGYAKGIALPDKQKLTVLTPRSIVNTLKAGYRPQVAKTPVLVMK